MFVRAARIAPADHQRQQRHTSVFILPHNSLEIRGAGGGVNDGYGYCLVQDVRMFHGNVMRSFLNSLSLCEN